jgi:hypothetical protein
MVQGAGGGARSAPMGPRGTDLRVGRALATALAVAKLGHVSLLPEIYLSNLQYLPDIRDATRVSSPRPEKLPRSLVAPVGADLRVAPSVDTGTTLDLKVCVRELYFSRQLT